MTDGTPGCLVGQEYDLVSTLYAPTLAYSDMNACRLKEYTSTSGVARTRDVMSGELPRQNPYSLLRDSLQKAIQDPNAKYDDIQALSASHFACKLGTTARGMAELI